MVEPVDPGQGHPFYRLQALPGLPMDHLGLVQAVDSFGERLIEGRQRFVRKRACWVMRLN